MHMEHGGSKMSEQKRLIAILRYLEDWDKLTRSSVSDVREHRAGFIAFQDEVLACPDVQTNGVHGEEDDIWMAIPRLSKQAPPALEEQLTRWVILKNNPDVEPRHQEFLELPAEGPGEE